MAQETTTPTSTISNVRSCVLCNRTLEVRTRSHQLISLRTDTPHHVNIRDIILERLTPPEIRASHYVCHPCWQKADRAALHYSRPCSLKANPATTSKKLRCANCGINLLRLRRHILTNNDILRQIQQKVEPQVVTTNDYVCDACHTLFIDRDPTVNSQDSPDTGTVGHKYICVGCGCSLRQSRSHSLKEEGNKCILDVVQSWIHTRVIHPSDSICHRCFRRAETADVTAVLNESAVNSVPQHVEQIILPNFSRAANTHRRCIFPQCKSTSQQVIPLMLRVMLFRNHNFYIPSDCRICNLHLARPSWTDLFASDNVIRSFTAAQIEDFCVLLKHDKNGLEFENNLDDNLTWHWLGL